MITIAAFLVVAAQELSSDTYEAIRDRVLPAADELKFRDIPWRSSFWAATLEAQKAEKPVLLWAMNGHPLACT